MPTSSKHNLREGRGLYRNYKNGRASISGFLEDYALVIQAYISLYEVSFDGNLAARGRSVDRIRARTISSTQPKRSSSTPTAAPNRSLRAKRSCLTT